MIAIWFDFFYRRNAIIYVGNGFVNSPKRQPRKSSSLKIQVEIFNIDKKNLFVKRCKLLLILKLECFENLLFSFQVEKTTL